MGQGRNMLWIGLVLIVAGGAVLAWGGPNAGVVLGTTMGLTGLGLLGWSWARGNRQSGAD